MKVLKFGDVGDNLKYPYCAKSRSVSMVGVSREGSNSRFAFLSARAVFSSSNETSRSFRAVEMIPDAITSVMFCSSALTFSRERLTLANSASLVLSLQSR